MLQDRDTVLPYGDTKPSDRDPKLPYRDPLLPYSDTEAWRNAVVILHHDTRTTWTNPGAGAPTPGGRV